MNGMVPGNWGVTAALPVEWLYVAVTENYASPEALATGPAVNDTVTGNGIPLRPGRFRAILTARDTS